MAYNKQEKYDLSMTKIEENKLYFVVDVCAFIGITEKTFYEWWNDESDESKSIKKALELNKIETKSAIRKKLAEGRGAAELIALYKILGTDEERKKLSSTFIDHTSDGKELKGMTIAWGENKIEV